MSDLISRKAFSSHIINVLGLGDEENGSDPEYMEGLYDCNEALMTFPSADILELARAIKEYCENCESCYKCGLSKTYIGWNGVEWHECTLRDGSPHIWNLPEGEKGGAE